MAARGKELERGLGGGPARAQAVGQRGGIGVARHAGGHALPAFEDLLRAGEARARQPGRLQAVGRGLGGVQLLGIRGVAQELPQARGLRAGRAQRLVDAFGIQVVELGHRGRGGERADGARGVEHGVVRAAHELADADAGLIAGDRRQQHLGAGLAFGLRRGDDGREHHRGRVQHRAVVHVVLLDHVRRSAVDQRGEVGRGAAPVDQHFGVALARPHGGGEFLQAAHGRGVLAGDGRGNPVKEQVLGALDHGGGHVRELEIGQELAQLAGRVVGVCGLAHAGSDAELDSWKRKDARRSLRDGRAWCVQMVCLSASAAMSPTE
ncbi:hypothetical protein D3C81_1284610 [compost metagenome]